MAAITDPGSAMAAITYPAGSVIDGIGYRVTVRQSCSERKSYIR